MELFYVTHLYVCMFVSCPSTTPSLLLINIASGLRCIIVAYQPFRYTYTRIIYISRRDPEAGGGEGMHNSKRSKYASKFVLVVHVYRAAGLDCDTVIELSVSSPTAVRLFVLYPFHLPCVVRQQLCFCVA